MGAADGIPSSGSWEPLPPPDGRDVTYETKEAVGETNEKDVVGTTIKVPGVQALGSATTVEAKQSSEDSGMDYDPSLDEAFSISMEEWEYIQGVGLAGEDGSRSEHVNNLKKIFAMVFSPTSPLPATDSHVMAIKMCMIIDKVWHAGDVRATLQALSPKSASVCVAHLRTVVSNSSPDG